MGSSDPLLSISGLNVTAEAGGGSLQLLRQVDFSVRSGEIHALAGESGSGKSTLARAVLRLFPSEKIRLQGEIRFDGLDLLQLPIRRLREVRGGRIGFILQEASAALNPYQRIGRQMDEMIRTHLPLSAAEARRNAVESLSEVSLEDPQELLQAYPHQLSLGMCQRVLIALALTTRPELLLADEPTASLDAVNARHIVDLLRDLNRRSGLTILFITHDCELLFRIADRVTVLYAGEVAESGPAGVVRSSPQHPYTQALLASSLSVSSAPVAGIAGEPPDLRHLPAGCPFEPRCPEASPNCRAVHPALAAIGTEHLVRCHNRSPSVDSAIAEEGGQR